MPSIKNIPALRRLRAVVAPSDWSQRAEYRKGYAGALLSQADQHDLAHRGDVAIELTAKAVETYRAASSTDSDGISAELAVALSDYGFRLASVGKVDEAIVAASESVEAFRDLAAADAESYSGALAHTLSNLGAFHSSAGQHEEALAATEKAVHTLQARTAQDGEHAHEDLARVMTNYSVDLNVIGRRGDALVAGERAIQMLRQVADQEKQEVLVDLGAALLNTSSVQHGLGALEESVVTAREGVSTFRRVAEFQPDAGHGDLGSAMNNLGIRLDAVGQKDEALQATAEAVETLEAARSAEMAVPLVASSLNNLALRLSEHGDHERAQEAAERSIRDFRQTAAPNASAAPVLPTVLETLGTVYEKVGRIGDAERVREEAREIARSYVAPIVEVGPQEGQGRRFSRRLGTHVGAVYATAFSNDGLLAAAGGLDRRVIVREVASGAERRVFRHSDYVRAITFGSGTTLISAGDDSRREGIITWDLEKGSRRGRIEVASAVYALSYSVASDILLAGLWSGGERATNPLLLIERALEAPRALNLAGHAGTVHAVAIARSGTLGVSGGDDGTVRIWNLKTCSCFATLRSGTGAVRAVALSDDERYVLSGGDDKVVRRWSVQTGSLLDELTGHIGAIQAVAFRASPDAAVSAGTFDAIRLWNVAERTSQLFRQDWTIVNSIGYSTAVGAMITGDTRGAVKLWRV